MKIAADRDVCVGAGLCVVTAPEVYDQDDDGIVVLLSEETDEATAREAVGLCPSGALRLVEEVAVLRVDAARNHDRIVDAAGRAFEEAGPGVTLEEVARRAGVGVATVYRRFGGRDGLVREVLVRAFRDGMATVGQEGDPWADLAGVVGAAVAAFAAHPVALGMARSTIDVETVQTYLAWLDAPLQRARAAGVVRTELTARDVAAVVVMALAVARHGPDARRRYLALLLDGLRPGREPLPI